MKKQADIGLIGLAVMGENLALNMESRGFVVALFNRTAEKTDNFINGRAAGRNIIGCHTLEELVTRLEKPRRVFMMVKAGQAVDDMIEKILPLLDDGDILIDGGNSHFPDTIRRTAYVEAQGKLYLGVGVSGGEEGALHGPSLMPGGSAAAWPQVRPILEAICARAPDGSPCCGWVGAHGAGHFVKMVHNGIEYGDMQLICEAYQLMRDLLRMPDGEIGEVFAAWNRTELNSYLIGITSEILAYPDTDGTPLVENILDTAGQKGTGKWAAAAALDEGQRLWPHGDKACSGGRPIRRRFFRDVDHPGAACFVKMGQFHLSSSDLVHIAAAAACMVGVHRVLLRFLQNGLGNGRAQCFRRQTPQGVFRRRVQAGLEIAVGQDADAVALAAETVVHGRDQPNAAPPPGDLVLLGDAVLTCRDQLRRSLQDGTGGHKATLRPGGARPHGHQLDKPDAQVILLGQGDKIADLIGIKAADEDDV